MIVSYPNDVKIYNLSAGKSLPEWLSDRKKRKLLQDDVDLRRRIELIQDFDMPDCSNCVTTSKNSEYVFICGTYKPRVKCYDVNNLSMKFERCMDAEPIKALLLSDSYEKIIFLQEERWIEFHVQYGRYFRLRIPKFGRDMVYNESNCDLYVVGSGNDVYRLNLEQGRFLAPFSSNQATSLTKCDLNNEHQLLACGTWEGCIEAWDPRAKKAAGILDTTKALLAENISFKGMPSISSIKFKDRLKLAVGTATGQILMYDIRSNRPYLIKDHNCDLPIKCIDFSTRESNLVLSMDKRALKLWHEDQQGKPYTTVEPGVDLNDLCLIKDTGLFFLANENQKVLTYYIPSVGPAPRWCSFLDNITEELEETDQPEVYDDYKFLTQNELAELGLAHLIGSKLLRAYMHGYFIDVRLYNKAKALTNPLAYQEYRKQKIREELDKERTNRVQLQKLPQVNRQLAERLQQEESGQSLYSATSSSSSKKQKRREKQTVAESLLRDDRFKNLFENPEFEIDTQTDEYKLLNPAMSRLEKRKVKKIAEKGGIGGKTAEEEDNMEEDEAQEPIENDVESGASTSGSSSSEEDDQDYRRLVKQTHKEINERRRSEQQLSRDNWRQQQQGVLKLNELNKQQQQPKTFEIKPQDEFESWAKELPKKSSNIARRRNDENETLESRLNKEKKEDGHVIVENAGGSREMSFASKKLIKSQEKEKKLADHVRDRRKMRRSAAVLNAKKKR